MTVGESLANVVHGDPVALKLLVEILEGAPRLRDADVETSPVAACGSLWEFRWRRLDLTTILPADRARWQDPDVELAVRGFVRCFGASLEAEYVRAHPGRIGELLQAAPPVLTGFGPGLVFDLVWKVRPLRAAVGAA